MAALALTFSQTSIAALVAGLATLLWLRLGRRGAALAAVLVVLGAAGWPPSGRQATSRSSASAATWGR